MRATVGETRAWLESAYGIGREVSAHYLFVARGEAHGAALVGCCDGVSHAASLARLALQLLGDEVKPSAESQSIIVSREDLRLALATIRDPGPELADAVARLAQAVNE